MPRGKRRVGTSGGRPTLVGSLSNFRARLLADREGIDAQIAAIDTTLAALGGAAPRAARGAAPGARRGPGRPPASEAGGGRAPRAGSLKDHIQRVLSKSGRPMSVKDITSGVLSSGYKSKNQTLAKSVGLSLSEMKNVARVKRGVFRMK